MATWGLQSRWPMGKRTLHCGLWDTLSYVKVPQMCHFKFNFSQEQRRPRDAEVVFPKFIKMESSEQEHLFIFPLFSQKERFWALSLWHLSLQQSRGECLPQGQVWECRRQPSAWACSDTGSLSIRLPENNFDNWWPNSASISLPFFCWYHFLNKKRRQDVIPFLILWGTDRWNMIQVPTRVYPPQQPTSVSVDENTAMAPINKTNAQALAGLSSRICPFLDLLNTSTRSNSTATSMDESRERHPLGWLRDIAETSTPQEFQQGPTWFLASPEEKSRGVTLWVLPPLNLWNCTQSWARTFWNCMLLANRVLSSRQMHEMTDTWLSEVLCKGHGPRVCRAG